jgi:hypothetical protein
MPGIAPREGWHVAQVPTGENVAEKEHERGQQFTRGNAAGPLRRDPYSRGEIADTARFTARSRRPVGMRAGVATSRSLSKSSLAT